ncbi:hypothetical protein Cpap_0887 [Ruminiclostridium papyrosolvens DSM 2782]|uniref:Uncharacterized protein n=1 Tax=Ruminiclostridium papyrosolvens DSM 2782 TaxID=588581 RepID=F1TH35_9FIRM|nr:DUF4145 domain-containing protein [Ruminiclostridium papyrosolvens]EGD46275.1 hypothetical protein Cpap_0887 [Ruminiclostridium papyrosolvens DSM 2782]WES33004.1 DUF4145 domain-containing protein [Ruminiclostridium papyrosolvens DSM 2782]
MNITISTSVSGNDSTIVINELSECPMCKHAIKPHLLSRTSYFDENKKLYLSVNYLCKACYNSFMCQYSVDLIYKTGYHYPKTVLMRVAPINFVTERFEPIISDSFPNFISIYNQALAAESYSLSEISGIGYRKALEFLIKDFLIKMYPEKEESIKNTVLGNCINNFIDNTQLKTAASRAVWLGNDQTHYIQKYTDKDITDLKRLIRLTVHWISMILETEEAEKIEQIK